MKTKKYKNIPNTMFLNEDSLSKLKMFQIDLKIFLKIRTLKEIKIVVLLDKLSISIPKILRNHYFLGDQL